MKLIVNDLPIEYETAGVGPPAVFLHGWGQDLHVYDRLAAVLAPSYSVVRLDLPGFGGSQAPPESWGVHDYAATVMAFCEKLRFTPAVLGGHSAGGQIAVHLAGTGMIVPGKLILFAASAVRPKPTMSQRTYGAATQAGRQVMAHPSLVKLRSRLRLNIPQSSAMQTIYRRIKTEDQQGNAANITCDTLLIWGDHDQVAPLARGKRLHQLIKHSRLEVIEGAGHFALIKYPNQVNQLVEQFLAGS